MKIAHVVDCMEVGGAETLVSQMCRLQREQGHDPSVYAVATLGPLGEQLRKEGFTVQPHVGRSLPDASLNFLRIFRDARPDVVHLHNPTPTIYAAPAARRAGVRSIVSTRHSLVAAPHRWVMEIKYALAATCCDWIVGICEATVNNLKSIHTIPARKIVRIYNGSVPLRRVPSEDWPTKTGFTLAFVGRLASVKNLTLLLNAFAKAHSARPDLRLWIIGDGNERLGLEKLATGLDIAESVTFWGQQLDVAPFLSAADAFIMASKSEGLPMSLLQAFSLGLPAIVTDVGGMAEVVRLAKAGITVSRTEASQMTAAILRISENRQEREQFAARAEEMFHSGLTLQAMVAAYLDCYCNTDKCHSIRT